MNKDQYVRVVSAIEYTLAQLRDGPKEREPAEKLSDYELRIDGFYKHKVAFVLYSVNYLRTYNPEEAREYDSQLRKLGCDEWAE